VIGKENTVPAFGFMFFKYKYDRPPEDHRSRGITIPLQYGYFIKPKHEIYSSDVTTSPPANDFWTGTHTDYLLNKSKTASNQLKGTRISCSVNNSSLDFDEASSPSKFATHFTNDLISRDISDDDDDDDDDDDVLENFARDIVPSKDVAIGAGAIINQNLSLDKRPLNEYYAEPQATIRLYFVFEEEFKEIIKRGGIRKIEEKEGGFLNGVPVGND